MEARYNQYIYVLCWLKKNAQPKFEICVLFSGLTEDLIQGYSLSDSSEDCSKEVKKDAGYTENFCKKNPR